MNIFEETSALSLSKHRLGTSSSPPSSAQMTMPSHERDYNAHWTSQDPYNQVRSSYEQLTSALGGPQHLLMLLLLSILRQ